MSGLGPYEIIATIMCRSNNHVVPGERLERAPSYRSRQMRAVAVEGNDALPARLAFAAVSELDGPKTCAAEVPPETRPEDEAEPREPS